MPTVPEKTCTRCGLVLPATREFFARQGPYLRAYCKECGRALTRAWVKSNPEKKAAMDRRYRAENAEAVAATQRAWREANREKVAEKLRGWRAANPARATEHRLAWDKAHPESRREIRRRWWQSRPEYARQAHGVRRARQLGGHVSCADYRAILAEFGMTCHICGEAIADHHELHFDHVVPLACGGAHSRENIRPSHSPCNLSKGARPLQVSANRT